METKPFYLSKTIWINAALAAAAVVLDAAPADVEWVALANIVLRFFFTNRGLTVT